MRCLPLHLARRGAHGAECEQGIVAACTSARLEDREVTEDDILNATATVVPLSKTMKEQVDHIRSWAYDRAVRASPREMFIDCLLGYQEYLRRQGRATWSAAVIDPMLDPKSVEEQFRVATHGIPFAKPPSLHFWDDPTAPIPLEIARVSSAAVARYVSNRAAPNPIFEAVRAKLAILPIGLTSSLRGRRR